MLVFALFLVLVANCVIERLHIAIKWSHFDNRSAFQLHVKMESVVWLAMMAVALWFLWGLFTGN